MTKSEELVYELSRASFLSIWSFANPLNKKGKELCDVLVVCGSDIIIFSVKESEYKDTGRPQIDSERWKRNAIDESWTAVYGAERAINFLSHVLTSDGNTNIPFPSKETRTIHRVAVALGSKERVPLTFGDFGKGFVHVFDEKSLAAIMSELDTITDFVGYLRSKEDYYATGNMTLFSGEEDLLAYYVAEGNELPAGPDEIVFDAGLWTGLVTTPEMTARNDGRKVSYVWDNIIERLFENFSTDNYRTPWAGDTMQIDQLDVAARFMARENRRMRKFLGESITGLLQHSTEISNRARIFDPTESPIRYVLMMADYNGDREANFKELQARCLVARGIDHSKSTVIGVLMELSDEHAGDAISVAYVDVPEWTSEWEDRMKIYQNELGFFKNVRVAKAN